MAAYPSLKKTGLAPPISVTEYLAWLNNQFENALDAADSDVPSEYQEGLTDGFDRAEAAFRDIFDVKEQ